MTESRGDEYWAKVEAAQAREREAENRKREILRLGGIRAYEQFTADRFKPSATSGPIFDAVKTWDTKKENLYLFGPVASGKSHLQAIAIREHKGQIEKVSSICRNIRAADNANEEREIIERYSHIPVFGIDDLGQEKMTEFVIGIIYEIIDGRYMNRPGGLIITSNMDLNELAHKLGDDRIPSRLAQMCRVFSLRGEKDYRLGKVLI